MNDDAEFLAAIRAAPDDNLPRLVYADWLDEHHRPEGAYLRAECEFFAFMPTDPHRDEAQARMREAGEGIDPKWIAAISRTVIEHCDDILLGGGCDRRWDKLQPTSEEGVRYCTDCKRNVHFCSSIEAVAVHAERNECVAIDPRFGRDSSNQPIFEHEQVWYNCKLPPLIPAPVPAKPTVPKRK